MAAAGEVLAPDDPRQVGGYALLRRLGQGGMGVVYLASAPGGAPVALKVIHRALADDEEFRRRFRREVAAARRVARFCTAPLLDADVDGPFAYLVTEYVEGPTLRQQVDQHGPLVGANLEALAVGTAVALRAIHGAGVVHCDLKPSNVLLSPLGPRVIDFGLARLTETLSLTSQMLVGTPAFMAPEQAQGQPTSPASDVFAWGGLVAFAGTGRLAFGGGSSPPQVLYRIVHEPPDVDGLEPRLRGLVEWALEKDPASRPTAEDLLGELLGIPRPSVAAAGQAVESAWVTGSAPGGVEFDDTSRLVRRLRSVVRLPPVRTRLRWLRLAGLATGIVLAVVAGAVLSLAPSRVSPLPFRDDFTSGNSRWETGSSAHGAYGPRGGAYLVRADPTWKVWRSAPIPVQRVSDVVVVVVADLQAGADGQAAYGVWCRGDPADGAASRYDLRINRRGEVVISKERAGGRPTVLAGPTATEDVNRTGGNRLVAQCRDVRGEVDLRLWVNGAEVASARDRTDPYPPGQVGVVAAAGRSQPASARFESFEASNLPDRAATEQRLRSLSELSTPRRFSRPDRVRTPAT